MVSLTFVCTCMIVREDSIIQHSKANALFYTFCALLHNLGTFCDKNCIITCFITNIGKKLGELFTTKEKYFSSVICKYACFSVKCYESVAIKCSSIGDYKYYFKVSDILSRIRTVTHADV